MNSELLKILGERLKELQKRKTELTAEKKDLDKVVEYMGAKGKKKLREITKELEEVDSELVDLDNTYVEYQRVGHEVKELEQLVKIEKKALTKSALEKLLAEKTAILEELETELTNEFIAETEESSIEENESSEQPTRDDTEDEELSDDEVIDVEDYEEVDEKKDKSKKKKTIRNVIIGGVCVLALVAAIKSCSNANDNKFNNETTDPRPTTETMDEQKQDETLIVEEDNPITLEEETEEEIEAEVYDVNTFDDITDIDKINARTSEIMESITPILNSMGRNYDEEELAANIRNTIFISNGELPIDNDGKQYYDPSVLDFYTQFRTDTFGNVPSSPEHEGEEIHKVNYADFTLEGSDLESFVTRYDRVYNNIAVARNNDDYEAFEKYGIELGTLLYNDWVLQGMNEEQNPYNFDTKQRLFALGAGIERYASYVMEYENGQRKTVCVPVCIDYKTGETREIPLEDIFMAIVLGESNDATLAINTEDGYQVISEEFYAQTQEIMAYNYENGNILTLK